jgi:hypothetical protein
LYSDDDGEKDGAYGIAFSFTYPRRASDDPEVSGMREQVEELLFEQRFDIAIFATQAAFPPAWCGSARCGSCWDERLIALISSMEPAARPVIAYVYGKDEPLSLAHFRDLPDLLQRGHLFLREGFED